MADEVSAELEQHIEFMMDDLMAKGMSCEEARKAALRKFGNATVHEELSRDAWGTRVVNDMIRDVRYSARRLWKSKGFCLAVLGTLALCIGASAAVFSLLNAVTFRTLPVENPHALREFTWEGNLRPRINWTAAEDVFSYQTYLDFRNQGIGFEEVFAFSDMSGHVNDLNVSAGGRADTAAGMLVTDNFFRGLGLKAFVGRTLAEMENRPDASSAVVISYAAWERYFGKDSRVLGKTVALNGNVFGVIGVLPPQFMGVVPGDARDFYLPMSSHQLFREGYAEETDYWWLEVMARLAPGARENESLASLEVLFKETVRAVPSVNENPQYRLTLQDASHGLLDTRKDLIDSLYMVLALVGILVLVACVNLAGLFWERGMRQQRELAIRSSLGGGKWRLARQTLCESLLIAVVGAGLGLIVATLAAPLLGELLLPAGAAFDVRNDLMVLGFTVLLSFCTTVLVGLPPIIRSLGQPIAAFLKSRSAAERSGWSLGPSLVAAQIGLTLILLIGAGLFARSLANLNRIEAGTRVEQLLTFELGGLSDWYDDSEQAGFHERLKASLRSLPGVDLIGRTNFPLLSGMSNNAHARLPGSSDYFRSKDVRVDSSFLDTVGVPLLRGRGFTEGEAQNEERVLVVNQAFVEKLDPEMNPLGRVVQIGRKPVEYQIVGVCRNFKYDTIKRQQQPMHFKPSDRSNHCYVIRTSLNAEMLVPMVRESVTALDPNIPFRYIKTQRSQLDESISRERAFAGLAVSIAIVVVLLSCIGVHALVANRVTNRSAEIGVRVAVGALPGRVARSFLWSILRMATVGIVVAVLISLLFGQVVRGYLFAVQPFDVAIFAGAILLLLSVSVLAAWIPASGAAKIDPIRTLRLE